ncbi:adenosine deaminase [Herbiconiux sp. 11R-BC]|uniref:adenosine deaminase n=1 Tax=Herbiconiux sp. 11R-BC TaxID=3111637 RepID=UPI003C05DD48
MSDRTIPAPAPGGRPLSALPKAHLHLHMEAALTPQRTARVAAAGGIVLTTVDLERDFSTFARAYLELVQLFGAHESLRMLFDEIADEAVADGVRYVELGVSPAFYAEPYGSSDAAMEAMIAAGEAATARTGVVFGMMVTVDRTLPLEAALADAALAAGFAGRGVVSLGLANDERGHPAGVFAEAFSLAKAAGLKSTPHGGELEGPESVVECLDLLGADRVQHGVRAVEDAALLVRLAASAVALDVCPTSNVLLGVAPDLAAHPLPALLDAGVRVTLNADDPHFFGVSLLDEYELCRTALGLSDATLAGIAAESIRQSALPPAEREAVLAEIAGWLASDPEEIPHV